MAWATKRQDIKRPNFFIVGAPKCATTSMVHYLRQHPDIFVALGEPQFFGSDIRYHRHRLTLDGYLSYFLEVDNEKRIGERSVWYLYSKRAAREIKEFAPDAKIVIQIRNPVDMLYSLHDHYVRTGRETIQDFEAALAAEEDRKRGSRVPESALFPEQLFYSQIPRYAEQIERYRDVFGWGSLHIVIFDDLIHNPLKTYQDVLRFLDVQEHAIATFEILNQGKYVKSVAVRRLMRSSWLKKTSRRMIPQTVRHAVGRKIAHWNRSSKPVLDESVRERLQREFAPEVERLSDLLGTDLGSVMSGMHARGRSPAGIAI